MSLPPKPDRWLPLLHEIADRADEIALRFFGAAGLRVETKPDASPVTEADQAIERAARDLVRERAPGVAVFGEEYGEDAARGGVRLIIDPIDGTKNFIRSIPVFGTLLGIEEDGELTAGVASAPALGGRWHAARGCGAFRGDRRLRVSGIRAIAEGQVFHPGLRDASDAFLPPGWKALLSRAGRTRGFGDFYQHLLVAEGAGEVALDPVMKPWDIAPLQVIVEEAGGRATTVEGERTIYAGSLVTSNGLVHDEALRLLRGPDV